ncbi:MAG: 2-succinylbenzoate-CoA ligase [Pelodictyon luteolum]|uniref:2-succinylbenzoate-CoA ligase n=1 Tax=Pelodictyon luteolum TaxID=1100 RepID=A0A165L2J9_PELLU|nr:o-succinylbenzoate--CoA ligase [Pelodictyon luteolum]KZK73494.1 MAG: 2-succinylbenzoate-CoA ligase [Pelodictyon luteolum]
MDPLRSPAQDPVADAATRFGPLPMLLTPEGSRSFRECSDIAGRIAAALLKRGIREGQRVAIISPNTPEMVIILLALLRRGMVAAPLNYRLPEARLRQMLQDLQPVICITGPGCLPPDTDTAAIDSLELLAEASALIPERRNAMLNDDDMTGRPVTIIHTSASTGRAKAVVHSLKNHWYNALGSNSNLPFEPGDTWLLSLPLFHVGGYALIFRSLASGGSIAIDRPGASITDSLERFPISHLSLVPTQLYRLLYPKNGVELTAGIKAVLLGGSASSDRLVDEAAAAGLPIYLSYGSTEMASQIATTDAPVTGHRADSGRVLQWREVCEAPDGELLVRGKCLCTGYLRNGAIDPVGEPDGWFHTGDIGSLAADGTVRVLGRKDGMFISGGENIHPEEVERALTEIRGVLEAVVAPVRDPEYGERPAAFIRTAGGNTPDDETLRREMHQRVGRLKTPVVFFRVCQWATLPGSEKTDRAWYRLMAAEYRGKDTNGGLPCA